MASRGVPPSGAKPTTTTTTTRAPSGFAESAEASMEAALLAYEHLQEQIATKMAPHWTAENVFACSLAFSWLVFLWRQFLVYRQYRVYVRNEYVPAEMANLMDQRSFAKARAYRIDSTRYQVVYDMYSQVTATIVLSIGLIPTFWAYCGQLINRAGYDGSRELLCTATFVVLASAISTVLDLPWDIYSTFVIEQKHGFNKQTAGFYAKDKVKKFVVMQLITVPILCGMIQIVLMGGRLFFLYLWLFVFSITMLLMTIYPDFIAPLFDKFSPLPEGKLRSDIEALASSLRFPLKKLYVVEGSKRSAHSNAYLYGMFNNKRIVLFDTLVKSYNPISTEQDNQDQGDKTESDEENDHRPLVSDNNAKDSSSKDRKGCSDEEVLAVLCHELGHWKMSHTLKNIIISQVHMMFVFMIFASLYRSQVIYQAFGFFTQQPILIGMLFIFEYIFSPYNVLMDFLMTSLSRHFEFQADEFARKMHRASYLRQALITLNKDNLGFPLNDPLYSAWHHSHPPLPERIEALGKND